MDAYPVELNCLASITGVFYLLGGASYEGRSQALGLSYLAGLQPSEYIFSGAELLLVYSTFFGYTFLFLAIITAALAATGFTFAGENALSFSQAMGGSDSSWIDDVDDSRPIGIFHSYRDPRPQFDSRESLPYRKPWLGI